VNACLFKGAFIALCSCVGQCVCVYGRHKVEEMLAWCQANPEHEFKNYAYLFLFTYSFLLRLPSEALLVVKGGSGRVPVSMSVLRYEADQLVLTLQRRKNKPEGSRLIRRCSCRQSPATCVYCRLKLRVESTKDGEPVFPGLTPAGWNGIMCTISFKMLFRCRCSNGTESVA